MTEENTQLVSTSDEDELTFEEMFPDVVELNESGGDVLDLFVNASEDKRFFILDLVRERENTPEQEEDIRKLIFREDLSEDDVCTMLEVLDKENSDNQHVFKSFALSDWDYCVRKRGMDKVADNDQPFWKQVCNEDRLPIDKIFALDKIDSFAERQNSYEYFKKFATDESEVPVVRVTAIRLILENRRDTKAQEVVKEIVTAMDKGDLIFMLEGLRPINISNARKHAIVQDVAQIYNDNLPKERMLLPMSVKNLIGDTGPNN